MEIKETIFEFIINTFLLSKEFRDSYLITEEEDLLKQITLQTFKDVYKDYYLPEILEFSYSQAGDGIFNIKSKIKYTIYTFFNN